MKHINSLLPILTLPLALILSIVVPLTAWANDNDDEELEFEEAELFFELNDTDGDLGIHALIDGEPWKRLEIEDPRERRMLNIYVQGRLRRQGLTEIFFESAEPTFDELPPEKFFRRFREGTYEIEGKTLDGVELESETELTHVMPAPPVVSVNGQPAAENCDADELPIVGGGDVVTLSWDPVTQSHPDLGTRGVAVEVVNYEVVAEIDETPFRTSTILPPEVNSFQVPPELLALNDEIKFEILVREESYNQTAVESCFCIEECPEEEE